MICSSQEAGQEALMKLLIRESANLLALGASCSGMVEGELKFSARQEVGFGRSHLPGVPAAGAIRTTCSCSKMPKALRTPKSSLQTDQIPF